MQKYATLHKSFLIFNNQLQKLHFPPKNLMKIAASMVFGWKKVQGSIFKKGSQFNSHFLLPCYVVVVLLHRLFSLICWHCHTEFVDIMKLNPSILKYQISSFSICGKKIIFQSLLFWGICKSRLYSLGVSTYIPVLDYLLYVY